MTRRRNESLFYRHSTFRGRSFACAEWTREWWMGVKRAIKNKIKIRIRIKKKAAVLPHYVKEIVCPFLIGHT